MFDYTMAAYQKTVNDCKKIAYFTAFALQIVYLLYLVYALFTSTGGTQIVNIILCSLSLAYFLFFVILTKFGKDIDAQKKGKKVKRVFDWCKRLIKLYTLGVMIFGVFQTVNTVTPLSVVFAVLMVVVFVLQIVFDILLYIVEKRLSLFVTAIMHDIKPLSDTKRNVGNFFKRLSGKETEPEQVLTAQDVKNLEVLDELVEKDMQFRREHKEAEKQRQQEEKQAQKEEARRQKLQAKQDRKAAKAAKKATREEAAYARKK